MNGNPKTRADYFQGKVLATRDALHAVLDEPKPFGRNARKHWHARQALAKEILSGPLALEAAAFHPEPSVAPAKTVEEITRRTEEEADALTERYPPRLWSPR